MLACACDPEIPLEIENRTDEVLTIYVRGREEGKVKPNSIIRPTGIVAIYSYYLIEAKNKQGEVVYSRNFTFYELGDLHWKVVIPPLTDGAESDNVTRE